MKATNGLLLLQLALLVLIAHGQTYIRNHQRRLHSTKPPGSKPTNPTSPPGKTPPPTAPPPPPPTPTTPPEDEDECPDVDPTPGDECFTTEGFRCEYGSETCCGVTNPSYVCECDPSLPQWSCFYTDACLFPECDQEQETSPPITPLTEAPSPSPDICGLDSVVGPCEAAIPRYYFNSASGECEKFTYGGCGGNANNFETPEDCEEACTENGVDDGGEDLCCDPGMEPGTNGNPFCFEGHACCPNTGEWSCSIGDGVTFPCGDETVVNPGGTACSTAIVAASAATNCCDPAVLSLCFLGSAKCCPEGEWRCPNGDTDVYPCGGGEIYGDPEGPICDATQTQSVIEPIMMQPNPTGGTRR